MTQFAINGGAASTQDRVVTLDNVTENNPTHYMASENPDFGGAAWQPYSTAPEFTLSEGYGEKTVYFKAKNDAGESNVVTDTITLQEGEWEVVYSSDFSADPVWMTNAPQNFYWNEADGNYYFKRRNGSEEYSYREVSYDPGATYRLEFDVCLTRCDWAASFFLSLSDPDMDIDSATTWQVSYHRVDQGQTASLIYFDSEGGLYHPGGAQPAPFQLNVWYHNVAVYDPAAGTLSLRVTRVSDGFLAGEMELTDVGSFPEVDRLSMSSVGHHYASGATVEGYIDNIVLRKWSPAKEVWEIVYQTDFSSEPNWITNDTANLSWNSETETFHGWQANTNTSYAYVPVELRSNSSFRLEFDVRINSVGWWAGFTFGLFDERLMYHAGVVVEYTLVRSGYVTALCAGNPSGPPDWEVGNWQTVVWYRNVIEYDAASGVVSFEARRKDDGSLLSQLSLSGVSSLPPQMRFLGVSRLHMEGCNDEAVDFDLDNITLTQPCVPSKEAVTIVRLPGPQLRISWDSESEVDYQLWATSNLASAEWVAVGPKMGGTGTRLYVDDYAEGVQQRFYRVEVIRVLERVTFWQEDFERFTKLYAPDDLIAAGWEVVNGSGDPCIAWRLWGPSPIDDFPWQGLNNQYVITNSDLCPEPLADEQLITPEIDCTPWSSVRLDFNKNFMVYMEDVEHLQIGVVDIRVRGQEGDWGDWVNLLYYDRTTVAIEDIDPEQVDISSYADGKKIQIRWYFHDAKFDYWFAVDEVRLSGLYSPAE